MIISGAVRDTIINARFSHLGTARSVKITEREIYSTYTILHTLILISPLHTADENIMEDSNSKKTNLTFSVDNILSNNFKRKSELDLELEHKIKQPPLKSLKEDTMKGKKNFT